MDWQSSNGVLVRDYPHFPWNILKQVWICIGEGGIVVQALDDNKYRYDYSYDDFGESNIALFWNLSYTC